MTNVDVRPQPPLLLDPLLWVVALAAGAVCLPFFRYVQWLGDEGVILHGADRVLRGEALYRDVFEFLPPGSFLIVGAWMKLVGVGFASVRVLAVGVIVAIAALLYASTRLSSGRRPLAALLAIVWVLFSQGAWTAVNHHWFTTAASMAAALALLMGVGGASGGARAAAAGFFAGIAAMVTPTRGALLCLAILAVLATAPSPRTRLMWTLAGMALFPAAMVLHLAATGALTAALDDVVFFTAGHYRGIQGVPFGSFARLQHAPVVGFFPFTLVLAGTALAFDRATTWHEPRFRASLALAIVGLIGAFPRPDLAHLNFTVPLACPLFGQTAAQLFVRLGRYTRAAVGALAIALCCVALAFVVPPKVLPLVAGPVRKVHTARGVIVGAARPWTDAVAALVARIDRVPSDQPFFFYPYSPMLPYLTGRRHVSAHDLMLPGYTTAEQYRETCVSVVRDAQWVVIDRSWTEPRVLRFFFPAMRDPDPPEKRGFEAALRLSFTAVVHESAIFELRQRAPDASPAACGGI